jgi:hypothetical protein
MTETKGKMQSTPEKLRILAYSGRATKHIGQTVTSIRLPSGSSIALS